MEKWNQILYNRAIENVTVGKDNIADMKEKLLTIGPFTIYGYGLMIAIGVLAAYFMVEYRACLLYTSRCV